MVGRTPNEIYDERDIFEQYRPWYLFLWGTLGIGRQAVVFGFLFVCTTFFHTSAPMIVKCETVPGNAWEVYCKVTKSFVRSFPLYAATMVFVLTGRNILLKYTWARCLRLGIVLDFDNIPAHRDPIVFFVLLEFVIGCCHFVLFRVGPSLAESMILASAATSNFVTPGAAFLFLLYTEYDIEAQLITLSKYVESNPQTSQQYLHRLEAVEESRVAEVVMGSSASWNRCQEGKSLDDALKDICVTAKMHSNSLPPLQMRFWVHRLWGSFWPTLVLLHPRLRRTPDLTAFRRMWTLYSCLSILGVLAVAGLFVEETYFRTKNVTEGETYDIIGITFGVVNAAIVLRFATLLSRAALRPGQRVRHARNSRGRDSQVFLAGGEGLATRSLSFDSCSPCDEPALLVGIPPPTSLGGDRPALGVNLEGGGEAEKPPLRSDARRL